MGMIDRFIGVGRAAESLGTAATGVAEVFRENATRRMELDEEAYARAIVQHGAEFANPPRDRFDSLVNGLNRLPRPLLALSTIGLFGYAMVEPAGFGVRMQGLALVPEPLWWLLGAIVSFYFGAREAHHFRNRAWPRQVLVGAGAVAEIDHGASHGEAAAEQPRATRVSAADFSDNAALRDWAATLRREL